MSDNESKIIMDKRFGVRILNDFLKNEEYFNKLYGDSISAEFMSDIYHYIKTSSENDPGEGFWTYYIETKVVRRKF